MITWFTYTMQLSCLLGSCCFKKNKIKLLISYLDPIFPRVRGLARESTPAELELSALLFVMVLEPTGS